MKLNGKVGNLDVLILVDSVVLPLLLVKVWLSSWTVLCSRE